MSNLSLNILIKKVCNLKKNQPGIKFHPGLNFNSSTCNGPFTQNTPKSYFAKITIIYHIYHTKYLKNENSETKNQNPMGEATSGSVFMLFLFFRHISLFLQALTNFVNFLQDISLENSLRKIFVHWLRETIWEMAENSKSQLEMIPRVCHVWISKKNKCKI